jgi:tetratricopeptide (TPR) repeat protein
MRAAVLLVGLLPGAAALGCGGPSVEVQEARAAQAPDPLDSVTPEELFRRGVLLSQHGDFVRAEQYLLAARGRGFDERRVIPALMEVCVRASRLSAAIGYAEPYLESHPDEWALRILIGSIHLGLGHLAEARLHLERALRDGRPEPAEAHYLLAHVLREQAELRESRRHFERYAELEPSGAHIEEVAAILREPPPPDVAPAPSPAAPPATVPVRLPAPTASGEGTGGAVASPGQTGGAG